MVRKIEVSTYMPADEVSAVEDAAGEADQSVSKYIRSHVPECDVDE